MKILGIETSADETAAAVVEDGVKLLSNAVISSIDMTAIYGGIVPEIAARSHLEAITPVIDQALRDATAPSCQSSVDGKKARDQKLATGNHQLDPWDQIDAIAVTRGPGLGGSLLIGTLAARTLAIAKDKPLIGVNHVQAHIYSNFLIDKADGPALRAYDLNSQPPRFPALALIVSGGHSQIVYLKSHHDYRLLGKTTDDAVGEAFDKVARLLGLPQPGGPEVAAAAKAGNPAAFKLPLPKTPNRYDFSFSGLKTAVLRALQDLCGQGYDFPSGKIAGRLSQAQVADMAASFQQVAVDILSAKLAQAFDEFQPASVLLAGGVAANLALRQKIGAVLPIPPLFPDLKLCTDNAAMVASLAFFTRRAAAVSPYSLAIDPSLKM